MKVAGTGDCCVSAVSVTRSASRLSICALYANPATLAPNFPVRRFCNGVRPQGGNLPGMRRQLVLAAAMLTAAWTALAQRPPESPGPWFGLTLPPKMSAAPAVRVGERPPRAVALPAGEVDAAEFRGAGLKADVDTIVGFARDSRSQREMGNGQMWGR